MKKLILLLSISLSLQAVKAQEIINKQYTMVKFQYDMYVSGNGLGGFHSPSLALGIGKMQFSIGPSIQSQYKKLEGIRSTFNYVLSPYCREYEKWQGCQLSMFNTFQIYANAPLSQSYINRELRTDAEVKKGQAARLTCYEATTGFSIEKIFGGRFYGKAMIGAGFAYTPNNQDAPYLERFKAVNQFGVAIGVLLAEKTKLY